MIPFLYITCKKKKLTPIVMNFNSGSMSAGDGNRIVETKSKKDVKLVRCTRWAEIQETVNYHAQMAALLAAPTVFRLLNDPGRVVGPQQFSIAERGIDMIQEDLRVARSTMANATPTGVTPLTEHVMEIRANVMAMRDKLRQNGQKVTIVLATDGLPTDQHGVSGYQANREFEQSLRSLEGLPVWIVVRLCTDQELVTNYYNGLDSQLELSLEVLDDFVGEAAEVSKYNKFLNYGLPIHRIRELGFHSRLFDMLDERKLTLDEVRELLILLLGPDRFDGVPDHHTDFQGFLENLERILSQEPKQWNPTTKKMQRWIDLKRLKKAYSNACCIM
mmetsp:Transcript_33705/g.81716  ORF Transcript_33705/g.81716 Transcript_33705/m.81716 type:complete len:332 (-) Transcript_33705:1419-2414(-)